MRARTGGAGIGVTKMQKQKTYTHVRFDTSVIQRAWGVFREVCRKNRKRRFILETWVIRLPNGASSHYDTDEEFFAALS